ncbi:MAG: ATP-binding protein [Actinomycetota bacterium]
MELPTGTLTFLFTDIEGSTRLLQELGPRFGDLLEDHHSIMRSAIRAGDGTVIRTEGDAFFVVFPEPLRAVEAVISAQRELRAHVWPHAGPLRVRMGMHTGHATLRGDDYMGIDVHRAARIAAAAHGGQVLISDSTRALVEAELPDDVSLRDLAYHRLKDLRRPEHLYQLVVPGLPADFLPIRSLETPTNLPAELTSFVGREREVAALRALMEDAHVVTLTGPGGAGKTRLALRVAAADLDLYPGGVHFVDLASVSEPALVASAIASAMGIREEGPRPMLETIKSELEGPPVLLVLDNFEQVIDGATLVSELLASVPKTRFLLTSRIPLRIRGEREFPVPPMKLPAKEHLPALEELAHNDAVSLFVQRAAAMDPDFALTAENVGAVAELCARLDGLPLAIELAASRARVLTPQAMLEHLDRALPFLTEGARDLPARQRTLRGAIAWSDELLTKELHMLFRRLSVFAGGFHVGSAQAVCSGEGLDAAGILDGLGGLLDGSLLRRTSSGGGEVRFDMLQTIREYGQERLEQEDDPDDIRRRHARYFLGLAEKAEPELRGPRQQDFLYALEVEHDNLRAALAWAVKSDDGDVGLRLTAALWRFWQLHGHLSSGRRWTARVLALPSAQQRTRARARALTAAGGLAYWQTDAPMDAGSCAVYNFRDAYEEALAISRELGDEAGIADGLHNLSYAYGHAGDMQTAGTLLAQCLPMFEQLGDIRGVADSLFMKSVLDRLGGDIELGRAEAERSLRMHREIGDPFGVVYATYALGRASAEMGDVDTARSLFLQNLDQSELIGDRTSMTVSLDNLAELENLRGRPVRAMQLAGASEGIKKAVGGEAPPGMIHLPDPRIAARDSLSEEEIQAAWKHGRAMTVEQAIAYAREAD